MSEVKQLLAHAAGVTVIDDPAQLQYPMPTFAEGKDDVLLGESGVMSRNHIH